MGGHCPELPLWVLSEKCLKENMREKKSPHTAAQLLLHLQHLKLLHSEVPVGDRRVPRGQRSSSGTAGFLRARTAVLLLPYKLERIISIGCPNQTNASELLVMGSHKN